MARLHATFSQVIFVLAFTMLFTVLPIWAQTNPADQSDSKIAGDEVFWAPENIIFQIGTDKNVYMPGETIRYTIDIINGIKNQECMRLKIFFPVDYEPLQGNLNPVQDYCLSNYNYQWTTQVPGITFVEEGTSGPNDEFLNYVVFEFSSMDRLTTAQLLLDVQVNPDISMTKPVPVRTGLMMYDCDPTSPDGLGEQYSDEYSDVTFHISDGMTPSLIFLLDKQHGGGTDTFYWGDQIDYTIEITYTGTVVSDPVEIRDVLPSGAVIVSVNSPVPSRTSGNDIIFELGSLTPGQTITIQMTIEYINPPSQYPYTETKTNTAELYFADTPGDVIMIGIDTITLVADKPDFEPIDTVPGGLICISPGHPYTFSVVINNLGDDYVLSAGPVDVCLYTNLNDPPVFSTTLSVDLASNQTTPVPLTWPNPPEGRNQTLYVTVNCSIPPVVDEMNFDNNTLTISGVNVEICDLNLNIYDVGWNVTNVAGRNGDCPDGIIGHFMLFDGNLHHVYNLAATADWLSHTGTTDNGASVQDVYNPVKEYVKSDPSTPSPNDVTAFELREIRAADAEPLDLTILTDSSIPNISTISAHLQSLLPATTTATETAYTNTLFDALANAIQGVGDNYRKAILLYSTGQETGSSATLDNVISSARQKDVPVFIIGYDEVEVSETTLHTLADSTGGYYWKMPQADVDLLNERVNELLHNYYAIYYASTYDLLDGGMRQLDMSVSYNGHTSQDIGWYNICWGVPDLQIIKTSTTTAAPDDMDRKVTYVDEEIIYTIELYNYGIDSVTNVQVFDIVPIGLVVNTASISHNGVLLEANSANADTVRWQIPQVNGLETLQLTFTATAPSSYFDISMICSEIINVAQIDAFSVDQNAENNTAMDTLIVKMNYAPPTLFTDKEVYVPREPIEVGALINVPCLEWILRAIFENGTTQEWRGTSCTPEQQVILQYIADGLQLTGDDGEETVRLTLEVTDPCEDVTTAEITITLKAEDYWYLSHNVYNVATATEPFDIIVSVSTDRNVRLKVLDISGRLVYDFNDTPQLAGETRYTFNLTDQNGSRLGAGIYIVTLSSGSMQGWNKFVVVR
ncbi:DUF11 domain-containing protein [candidate division KSB1 bacterium]|nr:DUF11 domain-containing protein [candidate division KSB1 bacterium]RQW06845.1 MAG: DUF11 domain-containing protein [candidate division KSB1 bacterium]